jgi:hypothetical protein
MKKLFWIGRARTMGLAVVVTGLIGLQAASATLEQTLDVLKVGTQTYKNVTVTTKSKSYVFIIHSSGMTNLKVADLTPDVLVTLGYPDPTTPKTQTNAAASWAKQTLAKLDGPQVKAVRGQIQDQWSHHIPGASRLPFPLPALTPTLLFAVAGVLVGLYLFHCFCLKLICKKSGHEPGFLVWLPLLQLIPMLRAAAMPGGWFFAFLVPGLNLVVSVVWCFKIAAARGKTALVAIFLLLPITSLFAFLYLAFSNGAGSRSESGGKRIEIMTLETA